MIVTLGVWALFLFLGCGGVVIWGVFWVIDGFFGATNELDRQVIERNNYLMEDWARYNRALYHVIFLEPGG